MTYPADCSLPSELLEQIANEGLACLPELIGTMINTAMQIERQQHIGAHCLTGKVTWRSRLPHE